MPEINYGELIAGEVKSLADKIASDKAERATADESRKKEIDTTLAKLDGQLVELKAQLATHQKHAITGIEYGSKGEKDKPTWTRLMQLCMEPERRKNTKLYGPELEMIAEVQKTAINSGTGAQGGFLVPTNMMAGILPELRERSIARLAGATVLSGLAPGAHVFAKSKGGVTAQHLNTEGEQSGTDVVPTFDQVSIAPKTIACFVPMTRGMMTQSAEALEPWVRGEVAKQIALLQDQMAFLGTGVGGQPRGIFNHPSVLTLTPGATTDAGTVYAGLTAALLQIRNKNALGLSGLGWVCEPSVLYGLAKIVDTNKRPVFDSLLNGSFSGSNVPARLLGYPIFDSAQLATATPVTPGAARLAFGAWSSLVIGEWGSLELSLNDQSDTNFYKARGTVRGIMDYDIGSFYGDVVTTTAAFVANTGVMA